MPYDPVERWEWEGGAVWIDPDRADRDESPAQPDVSREPPGGDSTSQDQGSKTGRPARGATQP